MRNLLHLILLLALILGPMTQPHAAKASSIVPASSANGVRATAYILTHEVFYGPHEFHPSSSGCAYEILSAGLLAATSTGCAFSVPIVLSGDATITGVTFYFIDNADLTSVKDISFQINAYDPDANNDINQYAGRTQSLSPSPYFQTITADTSINIDNSLAYVIRVFLPSDDPSMTFRFYGAKIVYQIPTIVVPHDEYLTIRGDSFLPADSGYLYGNNGPHIYFNTYPTADPQSLGHFAFPLNLVPGAKVTEVTTWYIDNADTSLRMMLSAYDVANTGGPFDILFDSPTTPTSTSLVTTPPIAVEDGGYTVTPGRQLILYFKPAVAKDHILRATRIKYTKTTPTAYTLALSGAQFLPNKSTSGYNTISGGLHSGDEDGRYRAGFHLRRGYAIKSITLYARDNNAVGQMRFFAFNFNPATGQNVTTPLVGTGDPAASTAIQSFTLQPTVFNPLTPAERYYALEVQFNDNGNLDFFGAVIEYYYDHPIYLPAVVR